MNYTEKTRFRYFVFAFTIAFFLLSLFFLMLMSFIHPKTPDSAVRELAVETSSYLPTPEDCLTVLFIGNAPSSAEADTFLLVRFDPVRGKVPVTALPPDTAIRNNDKIEAISQVFKYGGGNYTKNALATTLGITIDRYVRMDVDAFISAASVVGTVEFDLPLDMSLGQSGATPMTLAAGKQLLDGKAAANIIHYEDFAGGDAVRCDIISQLCASIIDQRIDIVLSTVVDKVFEKIINIIDTDISYPDYDNRKQAAEFLAKLGTAPAQSIAVAGEISPQDGLYHLSDTFIAALSQLFS